MTILHETLEYTTFIELVPTKYYICNTPIKSEVRAVLYTLSCVKTNNIDLTTTTEETEIFYYISDGYTNGLRANILYPFWCLNDKTGLGKDCPFTTGIISDWGLFKLAIFKNLDLKIIDKVVFDKTVEHFKEIIKNMDMGMLVEEYPALRQFYKPPINTLNGLLKIYPDKKRIVNIIVDKLVKNELQSLSDSGNYRGQIHTIDSSNPSMDFMTVGIRSVLRRVQNMLDFLIAFINENITNFDERNIDKYRPNYKNQTEKYNMEIAGNPDDDYSNKRPIFFILTFHPFI